MINKQLPVPMGFVERRIYMIRGRKVMLDSDLAELYGVPTYRLNEALKRNRKRFPEDFVFQLSNKEVESLTSQFAMSNKGRGGRRTLPHAFTEQGVAMLSSVLKSERAIEVNIAIMRAFVKLRELLLSNEELNRKIAQLEKKYEGQFKHVFKVINLFITKPESKAPKIGFDTDRT